LEDLWRCMDLECLVKTPSLMETTDFVTDGRRLFLEPYKIFEKMPLLNVTILCVNQHHNKL
jgi:hypothetical protein